MGQARLNKRNRILGDFGLIPDAKLAMKPCVSKEIGRAGKKLATEVAEYQHFELFKLAESWQRWTNYLRWIFLFLSLNETNIYGIMKKNDVTLVTLRTFFFSRTHSISLE